MNDFIEEGDYIRHINPTINGGLTMCVQKIDSGRMNALCPHFVGNEAIQKDEWFALSNLILVNKISGSFL